MFLRESYYASSSPETNSVTTSAGLFQSKEEKIVERYLNSKEGHAAILKAKKEGKSKKELLKMHKKDIVHLYSATEDLKLSAFI